jgi:hypothetical protein
MQSGTSQRLSFSWKLVVVCLALVGCTRLCGTKRGDLTPEQVVEGYLNIAFNMSDVSERRNLADYTTGNLKAAIDSASDETIKKAYIDRQYEIVSYAVVERRDRTPRETEVTFQLVYKDQGSDKKNPDAAQVTTENTVSVVRENGIWLIKDVMGNKTRIDFPVSAESRITAKAGGTVSDETPPAEVESEEPTQEEPTDGEDEAPTQE